MTYKRCVGPLSQVHGARFILMAASRSELHFSRSHGRLPNVPRSGPEDHMSQVLANI
jgi:hypothetical protein